MSDSRELQAIESLVLERKTEAARRKIAAYLRRFRSSEDAILAACEWYRRLGLYKEGLRLASRGMGKTGRWNPDDVPGARLLWVARFLYLRGATRYAYRITGSVKLETARDFHYAAEMCLAEWNLRRAEELFSEAVKRESDHASRTAALCRLGWADSLAGLGRFDEAIAIVSGEKHKTADDLMQSICLSCEGEYQARAGRYNEAKPILGSALKLIPMGDQTVDRAVLAKWLGYTECKSGDLERGRELLEESKGIFRDLGIREDATLDVARLEAELGFLSADECLRLIHFPGLPAGFQSLLPKRESAWIGALDAEFLIDLDASEARVLGKWSLVLPRELRLLGMLRIAGDWGLNSMRAITLLWPDEVFSLLQLEPRLEQLVIRLRSQYGIEIEVENQSIRLANRDDRRVATLSGGGELPSFLRERERFRASDLSEYYDLSRSQTFVQLSRWKEEGWITKEGASDFKRIAVSSAVRSL